MDVADRVVIRRTVVSQFKIGLALFVLLMIVVGIVVYNQNGSTNNSPPTGKARPSTQHAPTNGARPGGTAASFEIQEAPKSLPLPHQPTHSQPLPIPQPRSIPEPRSIPLPVHTAAASPAGEAPPSLDDNGGAVAISRIPDGTKDETKDDTKTEPSAEINPLREDLNDVPPTSSVTTASLTDSVETPSRKPTTQLHAPPELKAVAESSPTPPTSPAPNTSAPNTPAPNTPAPSSTASPSPATTETAAPPETKSFPAAAPKPNLPPARSYVVQEGDTLFDIAQKQLGELRRWSEIYRLNKERIGDNFGNLRTGIKLKLPPAAPAQQSEARRSQTPKSPAIRLNGNP